MSRSAGRITVGKAQHSPNRPPKTDGSRRTLTLIETDTYHDPRAASASCKVSAAQDCANRCRAKSHCHVLTLTLTQLVRIARGHAEGAGGRCAAAKQQSSNILDDKILVD